MTRTVLFAGLLLAVFQHRSWAAPPEIAVETPLPPPNWALLERELLRANAEACREFYHRYFDERGFLLCVERWGGDDGPDDAIENCLHWPVLHALGGHDDVLRLYKQAWEGHLRQYTQAKTVEVPFARDGMYFREFPVMFDWLHNSEGLTVFCLQGLSDPLDERLRKRMVRYAGFYTGQDPLAANYDRERKLIRSLFNGSRGPLLRPATALDWAGDPIEIEGRFSPQHGERNFEQMLAHFKDYNDIVGDHPQNMVATGLALNAFALTGDKSYRDWLLEYVGAWRQRMRDNGGIIPTKIGLDGRIGGESKKWFAGVYGWGFTVVVPQDGSLAHRNLHHLGLQGFLNAHLLTGDDAWLEPWRKQIDLVNAQAKTMDGRKVYPTMFGDQGWYNFQPDPYAHGGTEIFLETLRPEDRRRAKGSSWLRYLDGESDTHPEAALRGDLARVRSCVAQMRADTTTPDTRLADDSMRFNPASVESLVNLTMGGQAPGRNGLVLRCNLRYFDPARRRAGLPEDVAALIDGMTAQEIAVTLVNTNQVQPRDVVIQAGAYGEHQIVAVSRLSGETPVDSAALTVRLGPGCGERLTLRIKRFVNPPTLLFP